jgi:adenylylsulfate kinase-like enzyme
MLNKKNFKGFWFFGVSGSGKTKISKKIAKKIKNSFIIDGDEVRSLVSFDLGYSLKDRVKQNKRVLGLAKIVIRNNYFPIISSVYLDPKIFKTAKKNKIKFFKVITNNAKKINLKLKNEKNVVGKSITQPKLNCEIFINNF